MPVGVTLLLVLAVLIYFGLLQRILDRMHLSDKTALFFIGAMAVGTFLPNIPLGMGLSINIGGGLVPIGLSVYLIATADENEEKVRAIIAALLTGLAVYAGGRLLPAEPETMLMDPLIVFSILAGLIAYILGRSRRGAFVAGVMGILISDIIYALGLTTRPVKTSIGGAGVFDAAIIAGVIGVALCELVGETRERLQGGTEKADKEKEGDEK
ncbi:hypothetical protein AN618_02170 [Fervidicola ferrireducens]|uniref:DUF1614 domain-containing protein n=1 Tax=Fervidicola ferrireducens TaxID=520764 RepID=A0A140LD37_9FIRM|nr:DUF1614 domain-containing protein [Fervidicola ferrireducens]KXG78462.1 hypothetical protein AN618_02170 [Fervidicola ferrireducens]